MGKIIPYTMEKKTHVWNHQPDYLSSAQKPLLINSYEFYGVILSKMNRRSSQSNISKSYKVVPPQL